MGTLMQSQNFHDLALVSFSPPLQEFVWGRVGFEIGIADGFLDDPLYPFLAPRCGKRLFFGFSRRTHDL